MTLPTVTFEVSWTTDPGSAPVWVDESDAFIAATITRGKSREIDQFPAGTARVTVDNSDGRFTPGNTSGANYPDVLVMRRARLQATWDAVTYDLFNGYITGYPQSYQGPSVVESVLPLVDAFRALGQTTVSETYVAELSGTRISNVLDDAGWPAADRDIDTGQSEVAGATLDAVNVLTHLQAVAQSEGGWLYVAADGAVTFVDRHAVIADTLDAANYTFGNQSGQHQPERIVDPTQDDTDIFNVVVAGRDGGSEVSVSDATSVARYFPRQLSRPGLLLTSDDAVTDYANALLARHAEPSYFVAQLTVDLNHLTSDGVGRVLDRELMNKVRVVHEPPQGDTLTQDSFVLGVTHRLVRDRWEVDMALAPVEGATDFWVLGTSELGTGTRLGY